MLHFAQGIVNQRAAAPVAGAPAAGAAGDDANVMASYVLALCGWEPAALQTGAATAAAELVVECGYCRMAATIGSTHVVCWPPKKDIDPYVV